MIGRTLSFYLAQRFARTVFAAFMVVFVIIYAADLVELLRRSGDSQSPASSGPRWVMASRMACTASRSSRAPAPKLYSPAIPHMRQTPCSRADDPDPGLAA